jgi:hypothetical protein
MTALIKLTKIRGVTNFENPTYGESRDMGPPCELLYGAVNDHRLALDVEKYAQIE